MYKNYNMNQLVLPLEIEHIIPKDDITSHHIRLQSEYTKRRVTKHLGLRLCEDKQD